MKNKGQFPEKAGQTFKNILNKNLFSARMNLSIAGKKFSIYPARLFALLVAVIVALAILVQIVSLPVHRPRKLAIDLETGGAYTLETYENKLLMYNKRNIKAIDKKGETSWSVNMPLSHPQIEIAGDYVLAVDLGGNNDAILYKDGKRVCDYKVGKDIISAKVNKNGMTVFASAVDGYKGKVTVYDKKGREKFSWNSADGYIMDVAINPSGRYIAVAQLSSQGQVADSRIQFIDLYRKKPINMAEQNDGIVGEIEFAENRLISVSDSAFTGYSDTGRHLYTVSLAGKKAEKYDISGGSYFTVVTKDNRGNDVMEIYNKNGRLKGRYQASGHITAIQSHKDMIVAGGQREVCLVSPRGKLKKSVECKHDIQSVGVFDNERTVLVLGNNEADIFWMR